MFKLMLFKLLTLTILSFIKGFFAASCFITIIGTAYLTQIVSDLILFTLFDWVVPLAVFKFKERFVSKGKGSDEDQRPSFDVGEEYIELIYRQHLIYSGMPAFPGITFVALFTNCLNLLLDKARLIKICKKPPRTLGSLKTSVAFFMLLSAILSCINFGGGSVYTLVGYYWCNPDSSSIHASCIPAQCLIMANQTGTGFLPSVTPYLFPFLYPDSSNSTNTTMS
jgi:hypothetical protein